MKDWKDSVAVTVDASSLYPIETDLQFLNGRLVVVTGLFEFQRRAALVIDLSKDRTHLDRGQDGYAL